MDQKEVVSTTQPMEPVETYKATDIPPHLAQSAVHTVLVNYTNWLGSKAEVIDARSEDVLYTIKHKTRSPQVRIYGPGDISEIASATYHLYTFRIDVDVRGQPLKLKLKSILGSTFLYDSLVFQNQKMTWKSDSRWKSFDYVCLNENQLPVAKFSADLWRNKKMGKLEFLGSVGEDAAAREELLITGVALMYFVLISQGVAVV